MPMKSFTLLGLSLLTTANYAFASSQDQRIGYLEREVSELRQQVRNLNAKVGRSTSRSATANASSGDYRVKRGDTLWGIARAHGISVSTLQSANSRLDPSRLRVGSTLNLPGRAKSSSSTSPSRSSGPPSSYLSHAIRSGETLGEIANRHHISLRKLMAANPGLNPRRLQIGQKISVPGEPRSRDNSSYSTYAAPSRPPERRATPAPAPEPIPERRSFIPQRATGPELVTVSQNRRLGDIARFYGTDVPTINSLNQVSLSPAQIIKMGSQLYVPQQ